MMNAYSGVFIQDGLSADAAKTRYRKRREALAKAVGCPIVICGVTQEPGHENRAWYMTRPPIYQDPIFLFLTGINQHCAAILCDASGDRYQERLFLPKKDPKTEFWDGLRLGVGSEAAVAEASSISGFDDVRAYDDVKSNVATYLKNNASKALSMPWYETKDGKVFEDRLSQTKQDMAAYVSSQDVSVEVINLTPYELELRLPLDEQDRANLESAVQKTTAAFTTVLAQLKEYDSEAQAAAVLDGEIAKQSTFRNSFPSIVASGKNAAVLHYSKNDETFPEDSLLLMDFGVRHYAMHADITRAVPVNGRFNPLQACMYQIVLDTQLFVESIVKPGVTITEINKQAWEKMEALIKERVTDKGGVVTRAYETQPHNIGHFLGHMVHDGDPTRIYRDTPLVVGQAITNEPGFYGEVELEMDGQVYKEHLGIRIEDDLLIAEGGCINLSQACPKTIKEIEAFF